MTMPAEKAAELRKPFPKSAIGKLPKPYNSQSQKGNCPECHGYHGMPAAHLDYVGHAATTDRLLAVDPDWSWEPFALDVNGLPALDGRGNLWIRLTICGVTRIGVGDGKNAKEIIGDAIRNAAMRFGVALDLWGKEELEQAHGPARPIAAPAPAPQLKAADFTRTAAVEQERDDTRPPEAITTAQLKALHASLNDAGVTDKPTALAFYREVTGRDITSSKDLTRAEASNVIDALKAEAVKPADLWAAEEAGQA